MKTPSRDISVSLIEQAARQAPAQEQIVVERHGRSLSMTVPGDGDVHAAPGRVDPRSAGAYVIPQSRFGGVGNDKVPPARSERRRR